MELVKYDAACRAIAMATTVDEVKEISNRAEALRAYARQAKNRSLELDAMQIRVRAERRLGEMLLDLRKEKTFKEGRPRIIEDLQLNGNFAAGVQRLALVPPKEFDAGLTDWRTKAETNAAGAKMPFQNVRNPSNYISDRKRSRRTRVIDQADPLDHFRLLDDRSIADCLVGEIRRLEILTRRQLSALQRLGEMLPSNSDTLTPIRQVLREVDLCRALTETWAEAEIPNMPSVLADLPSNRGGRRQGSGRKRFKGDERITAI